MGGPNSGNPNVKNYGFGSAYRTKEEDDEYRSRIAGVPKTITWTKEKCVNELDSILQILKKILLEDSKIETNNPKKLKQESIRDLNTMMNRILEFMKYLYPPVTTNVNVNIDMTANAVIQRLREWKKKQEVVIVDNIVNIDNNIDNEGQKSS